MQAGPDWTSSVLSNIACPAALTCYIAGSRGTIARIANGTTVTAQRTPTARDLYGTGCAGPAACYAVGDNGTILAGDVASAARVTPRCSRRRQGR